ncbi:MAG: FAD-dependent thymidylate synthase [Phycisphaerales bacterium]
MTTPSNIAGRTPIQVRVPPAAEAPARLIDVMDGQSRRQIDCYDHGFVALIDVMPRLIPEGTTADAAIVQAARVSYGQGTKKTSEDRGLVRYLLRHRHTTPFEMVEFKFHMAMPIFVARQWIRHRTASVNEYSGRYSIMPDRFYRPTLDNVRKQSSSNRQGGEERFVTSPDADPGEARTAEAFLAFLDKTEALYAEYLALAEKGVTRELARIGLPVSLYTEWYWKCDLHNLLRFLSLRMDAHAQEEIRTYATAMHDLIAPIVPITIEAWRDYELESMRLTRLEIEAIRRMGAARGAGGEAPTLQPMTVSENKREQAEWEAKRARLGL